MYIINNKIQIILEEEEAEIISNALMQYEIYPYQKKYCIEKVLTKEEKDCRNKKVNLAIKMSLRLKDKLKSLNSPE